MNELIPAVAREVATQINRLVDLPFLSEDEEEIFFQLLVTKVFEVSFRKLVIYLNKH